MNIDVYVQNLPNLTPRQNELYQFIVQRVTDCNPPSTREMAKHMSCSQPNALQIFDALVRKGLVKRETGCARGVTLVNRYTGINDYIHEIPLFGHIPAGLPENAVERCDEILRLDVSGIGVRPNERLFALRVHGDSMINAHIIDGDITVMAAREPVHHSIVAALIDNETTLKRYVVVPNGDCYLKAENPLYADLTPVVDLRIQGVMIALLRGHK